MTEFKNENPDSEFDNLLKKFYSADEVEQIKQDFAEADELFERFSEPQPNQRTLAEIKQRISQKLEKQQYINRFAFYIKTAAAVAIIVIISGILISNYSSKPTSSGVQKYQQLTNLWQIDDISLLDTEIEQLRNELIATNLGEDKAANGMLSDSIDQLELEIIEVESAFWKG